MAESSGPAKAQDEIVVDKKSESDTKKTQGMEEPSFNMTELRDLANLVIEHGFTDFEFENENIRVRLSKNSGVQMMQQAPMMMQAAPQMQSAQSAAPAIAEAPVDEDAGLHKITSPIVGTFYRSPGPDKDAYVSEGTRVSADTTVCIVEAMKLMNEIQAEISGEIIKIYVENGQPVEYGQPLFGVKQ